MDKMKVMSAREIDASLRQKDRKNMTRLKDDCSVLRVTRRAELLVFTAFALSLISGPCLAGETTIPTKEGTIRVETIAHGLQNPWGLVFLPDGRMLVTERPGRLRIVTKDGAISEPLKGVPEVFAQGQGGLLDVKLDPDFTKNRLVYITYSEPGDSGAGTAVARGKLGADSLDDVTVIFRQQPKVGGTNHFGGRLAFAPGGKLFVSLGERFTFTPAQDLSNDLGKIVRINSDGSVPQDNPFVGKEGARPEIWTYGHRNPQGLAFNPKTGKLFESEFGPKGGDEINVIEPGKNYGWPVVSWGDNYDDTPIPKPTTHPEFIDAIAHWNPVISPSGIAFYTGDAIPGWKDNLLIAGLSSQAITRLTLDGEKVTGEERIPMGARIRDVVQGPDNAVYALTDAPDGAILRIRSAGATSP
jgi:glucose/arabinose dehydrogenase